MIKPGEVVEVPPEPIEIKTLDYLSVPLPKEAIQRTKGADTRKGYDTTGYGYQYAVNRFNDTLGDKWSFEWNIIKEIKGQYKNGSGFWDITVSVSINITPICSIARKCVGGHISKTYADALKGAITNAFKKTAAFWGVGKEAYEGSIDDDNKPYPDSHENKANSEALVTTLQLKRLGELMRDKGWKMDDLNNACHDMFNIDDAKKLTQDNFNELFKIVNTPKE